MIQEEEKSRKSFNQANHGSDFFNTFQMLIKQRESKELSVFKIKDYN